MATTNALEVGGEASKATAGDWVANSDVRLKKNIQTLNPKVVLQQLLSLKGVTYEWNDTKTGNPRPQGSQYGFTAQNIQEVFPSLVSEDKQGFLQTAYGTYDAMTVEAIRALYDRIIELEDDKEKLKSDVDQLKKMNSALAEKLITEQDEKENLSDRIHKIERALDTVLEANGTRGVRVQE